MADYSIKYQISYYRKSGSQTTINILEKDYAEDSSGGITTLTAAGNPLEISFEGDVNNIYKPTIGSGATIRVMATPLSLQGLFTTDPQKYKVHIYDGNDEESSGGSGNLIWQGFVNAGIYTESYSTPITLKSLIIIYCNDGLSLLNDLLYTQTVGGSNYTGFSTKGVVMENIFGKLELYFSVIRTATDLQYDGHTNLFTAISVNNENYYDEQGVAMSCRSVLESIIGGLGGLVLFLRGDKIYIIDPIHLHTSYGDEKQYDTHPSFGSNESGINIGGYLDIAASEISWYQTGQNLDIVQLFNYIDITYDPYNYTEWGYDFNNEDNVTNPETYSDITNNGINYYWYIDNVMSGWTVNAVSKFEAIKEITPDVRDIDYFIRQTVGGDGLGGTFVYTFPFSNIQQDDNLMLELSMDVYVNTRHATNIIDPAEPGTDISSLYLNNIQLKVGSKWYYQATGGSYGVWSDTVHNCKPYVRELDAEILDSYYIHGTWFRKRKYHAAEDKSEISDKWITSFLYIPLAEVYAAGVSLVNGAISIIIPKATDASVVTGIVNILIKNVSVGIIDINKKPILNDGVLTNAVIDSAVTLKKSVLDIQLTNGIGLYGVSRGAFSSNENEIEAGLNITGLDRGDSVEYNTTELLLQSLMGEYGSPRFKLTGKLNVVSYLFNINLYLIKDTGHLDAKAFYIVNGTYNDREEYMDVEMLELTDTRQTIT